ncbi:hypothetical protein [Cryobacterium sp. 5B3]|nr:hypothetical protein [Cryobacterium sp. 5B3]MDY7541809.1 hypothetical protein [Cryobacterium sp. 5B3]MEB0276368.1 hypothetical protein [Cryobacterium sp. 5B3]
MTLILNVLLILNLVGAGIYALLSPGPPSGAESYISSVIEFGVFATLAAIPLIIGNLRWRLDAEAAPVESIALRHRVGSWKLIKANRFLSLIVWCGYPLASILMLIHPMG